MEACTAAAVALPSTLSGCGSGDVGRDGLKLELAYRELGAGGAGAGSRGASWIPWRGQLMPGSVERVAPLQPLTAYEFRVRAASASHGLSEWSSGSQPAR